MRIDGLTTGEVWEGKNQLFRMNRLLLFSLVFLQYLIFCQLPKCKASYWDIHRHQRAKNRGEYSVFEYCVSRH